MEYDFDLDNVVDRIKKEKAKLVCIQLADGIKPRAVEIQGYLEKKTGAKIIIWLGSCWGACDVPVEIERLKVDLIVQFGHNDFIYGRYYGGNVV